MAVAVLVFAGSLLMPSIEAGADSATVGVTASIAPSFSLTLLTDGSVAFGQREAGDIYTASEQQRLRVVSSQPWDFTDTSDDRLIVGAVNVPRDSVLRHIVSPDFGTGLPAGVHEITCTYVLDLTTPEAASIPAGTPISTDFGYTAVQR